jgi:hypothetical protein
MVHSNTQGIRDIQGYLAAPVRGEKEFRFPIDHWQLTRYFPPLTPDWGTGRTPRPASPSPRQNSFPTSPSATQSRSCSIRDPLSRHGRLGLRSPPTVMAAWAAAASAVAAAVASATAAAFGQNTGCRWGHDPAQVMGRWNWSCSSLQAARSGSDGPHVPITAACRLGLKAADPGPADRADSVRLCRLKACSEGLVSRLEEIGALNAGVNQV